MRLLAVLTLVPMLLQAQAATVRLAEPDGRLAEEFSDLVTMRELLDGRLLLSDRKEERLVVADFARNAVRDIARQGSGPREIEMFVAKLLPLGNDITLAAELNRWSVVLVDSVASTLRPDSPARLAVPLLPLGYGNGYLLANIGQGWRDSSKLGLVRQTTGALETIATLYSGPGPRSTVRTVQSPDGPQLLMGRVPLQVWDQPALFRDGWVAIARVNPYRVDWRSPNGQWTRGAPLPFTRVRMTEREQAAYGERFRWSRNMTAWPEFMPPFDDAAQVFPAPEGLLVVRRAATADRPETRYDVVDRTGALRGELVLPRNQHILGFGARSVYVVDVDDDGIQRVNRHAWPAAPLRG